MRNGMGMLGNIRGYSRLVSLIDVRIPRVSLQEGLHLFPILFRSSLNQGHASCVCGESVCGYCVGSVQYLVPWVWVFVQFHGGTASEDWARDRVDLMEEILPHSTLI
jgi:hypothetical protein